MPTRTVTEKPAPRSKTAANANAGEFDFTALTVEDAPAPRRETQSPAFDPAANPANAWLTDSWENREVLATTGSKATYLGKGKRIVVPNEEAAKTLENLIRKAGQYLTATSTDGSRIGVTVKTNTLKDGKVEVLFAAKTAKEPRKAKAAPAQTV